MIRSALKVLIPAIVLVVVGCRTVPRTMYEVDRAPIVASSALSMAEVEKAIRAGGASSGWVMTTLGTGNVEGSYAQSRSRAVVAVTYDTATFSIKYKDSENLRYEGDKISVHYNGWVQNLERAIRAQLAFY
jgi:hypothetical protein